TTLTVYLPLGRGPAAARREPRPWGVPRYFSRAPFLFTASPAVRAGAAARGKPRSGGVPRYFSGAHFILTASQGMRARALPFGAIVMRADFTSLCGGCLASLARGAG